LAVTVKKDPAKPDAPSHFRGQPVVASQPPLESEVPASWQDDLRLMTLVAAGDVDAMNAVAQRLSGRVRRLARAIVRNEALADDAAQIALIAILQSARTYGARSSLERWSDRITARIALRQARDDRRRGQLVESLDEQGAIDPPAPERDPADDPRGETPRSLDAYLNAIPEVQREALVMKHTLGYTVEEIAEATGVPVGTVKDRLVTARKNIRRIIQRELAFGRGKVPAT
jgi:RNA polymerase sigma-70 factor (ECF subfamily)